MLGPYTCNGRRAACATLALMALSAVWGCNIDNEGDTPSLGAVYFPNALSISVQPDGSAPRFLFVASSNFDLRYNAGAVHAFSLDAIDEAIDGCKTLGADDCIVSPGAVLADEVLVPSFTTAMDVTPDGRTLLVTTRTGGSLRRIDIDPEADDAALEGGNPVASKVLRCGDSNSRSCGRSLERGEDPRTGERWSLPDEPAALVTGQLSELTGDSADEGVHYAVLAHQLGDLSLLIEREQPGGGTTLEVASVLESLAPPSSAFVLTGIARDPVTGLFHVLRAGDSVLFRAGVTVDRNDDGDVIGTLFDAGRVALRAGTVADVRALAFAPAIAGEGPTWEQGRALLVSRSPSALVVADVDQTRNPVSSARVLRTVEVGVGASRLVRGTIAGRSIAVVSCFDMRELHVVDLATMQTRAVVPNLSGPHALVLDEARERVYVADFRSSVVRIVDLSPLSDASSDRPVRTIASLGRPRVIQELQ